MQKFPYASIHYCKCSLHPWSCLDILWLILESGSILRGTSYVADVFRGLNWHSPSVWPVSIHRNVQKHGTQCFTAATDVAIWWCMVRQWMDMKNTVTSTCYRQGDGFQDGSKNGTSVKSVLLWGLHQNPSSPNDTITHPRKPEYSANHATRASNFVTKEMTAYWYFYINRLWLNIFGIFVY
jgi:hypothetical protein